MNGYATDTQVGDVPLKLVGCQVIKEAQSAQPHRQQSQSASVAQRRAAERERDPNKRGRGGKWGHGNVTKLRTVSYGCGGGPLTAVCPCSLVSCVSGLSLLKKLYCVATTVV